jgi:hypothetical protein
MTTEAIPEPLPTMANSDDESLDEFTQHLHQWLLGEVDSLSYSDVKAAMDSALKLNKVRNHHSEAVTISLRLFIGSSSRRLIRPSRCYFHLL